MRYKRAPSMAGSRRTSRRSDCSAGRRRLRNSNSDGSVLNKNEPLERTWKSKWQVRVPTGIQLDAHDGPAAVTGVTRQGARTAHKS